MTETYPGKHTRSQTFYYPKGQNIHSSGLHSNLRSNSSFDKGIPTREPAQTGTKVVFYIDHLFCCGLISFQIYYASRTHSQLTQVFGELSKLKLTHSTAPVDNANDLAPTEVVPRSVTLASRTHLCLNDALRKRTTDLDEGCRDLLNGICSVRRCPLWLRQSIKLCTGSPADRCPFLTPIGDETRMLDMRDRILVSAAISRKVIF